MVSRILQIECIIQSPPASRLHRGPPGWAAMALIIKSDGVVILMMESNSGSVRNGGT